MAHGTDQEALVATPAIRASLVAVTRDIVLASKVDSQPVALACTHLTRSPGDKLAPSKMMVSDIEERERATVRVGLVTVLGGKAGGIAGGCGGDGGAEGAGEGGD